MTNWTPDLGDRLHLVPELMEVVSEEHEPQYRQWLKSVSVIYQAACRALLDGASEEAVRQTLADSCGDTLGPEYQAIIFDQAVRTVAQD